MRRVRISDLKARLSAHLKRVQEGEEVIVCDRDKPVARIVPIGSQDEPEREQRLISRGVMLPPLKPRREPVSWPRRKLPGNISAEVMRKVWEEEREGR